MSTDWKKRVEEIRKQGAVEMPPELDEEDEEILSQIWDRYAKGEVTEEDMRRAYQEFLEMRWGKDKNKDADEK